MELPGEPPFQLVGAPPGGGLLILRAARVALWILSITSIVAFLVLSWARLACPIELGNGEGMMLDNAIRVATGRPLYVEPTLHFIPFVYMPLYPTLITPLIHAFGPALWQGRLVDLIATLAFLAIAIVVIRHETDSLLLGFAGAGLYLMGHGLTRGGYDVIRPDPLMIALVFGGLAVLRFAKDTRGAVLAGAICGFAFFAKQHALLFNFAAYAYLLVHDRRRLMPFALASLAVAGGGYTILSLWLGPWFSFYVQDVPSHWSQFSRGRVITYLGEMLIGRLGPLTLPVAFAMTKAHVEKRGAHWLWYWAALGGIATGLLATFDPYAYFHVLMPTIAALSVAGPIAADRVGRRLAPAVQGPALATCLVLALQYLPLLYPIHTLMPRPGAAAAHRDLIAKLHDLPGPVLMPYHGYYATIAGKGMGMTVLPLDDILRAKGNRLLKRDPRYFERMFDSLRTGAVRPTIVADTVLSKCGDASLPLWRSLEGPYRVTGDMGDLIERLRPLAGARNAPTWIYTPVSDGAAATRSAGP